MLNPFTLQSKIAQIQSDVLSPLYTDHPRQGLDSHQQLMAQTGDHIAAHAGFIKQICTSTLVSIAFSIVKFLGGAPQLTREDFDRFTNYVRDGGLEAMLKMLHAADMEVTFISELQILPANIQQNAPGMLRKSRALHDEFITDFFRKQYGSTSAVPDALRENKSLSEEFIERLAALADTNLKRP
ncbi:hypothetical protein [Desulfogranum japonicum]|uniref:hypothetical protein n=1 Tax=Desulfogranum japonicum TaxID=231447 RepID=UPI0003F52515|nr:hypothetical protein [Desulfogranum japonicum]